MASHIRRRKFLATLGGMAVPPGRSRRARSKTSVCSLIVSWLAQAIKPGGGALQGGKTAVIITLLRKPVVDFNLRFVHSGLRIR
jgi:hypothetical protein